MIVCQNCGESNETGQNYCRQCGAPLVQMQKQTINTTPQPKPYGWASPSSPLHKVADEENTLKAPNYQPPVYHAPHSPIMQTGFVGYRCPRCGATAAPIAQSKISDGGWIVFVLMLIFCFPLFFIGLLMREQYRVCPACLARIG